jgi:hypothetical protein
MQSVQRHFGKYMKRTADEGQVSVLLKDFDDADQLLTRVRSHDFMANTGSPSSLAVGRVL